MWTNLIQSEIVEREFKRQMSHLFRVNGSSRLLLSCLPIKKYSIQNVGHAIDFNRIKINQRKKGRNLKINKYCQILEVNHFMRQSPCEVVAQIRSSSTPLKSPTLSYPLIWAVPWLRGPLTHTVDKSQKGLRSRLWWSTPEEGTRKYLRKGSVKGCSIGWPFLCQKKLLLQLSQLLQIYIL